MLIKYNEHLRQCFKNMFAEPRMTGGKRFNLERHIGALDPHVQEDLINFHCLTRALRVLYCMNQTGVLLDSECEWWTVCLLLAVLRERQEINMNCRTRALLNRWLIVVPAKSSIIILAWETQNNIFTIVVITWPSKSDLIVMPLAESHFKPVINLTYKSEQV